MTKAIYAATAEYEAEIKEFPVKRRVSVSGILNHLGVSRSGYNAWKNRVPSDTQKRREEIMQKVSEIYNESHQNYGAPKITKELQKAGVYSEVSKDVIRPSAEECVRNPRAKSTKMRWAVKA